MRKAAQAMTGRRKAAIILAILGHEVAAEIIKHFSEDQIETISLEMARMEKIGPEMRANIIAEFHELAMAQDYIAEGGVENAKRVLEGAFGADKADVMIRKIMNAMQVMPFEFLKRADPQQLLGFIQDEHPQTIALIVSHLAHHKAAEILIGLPTQKQIEVVKRIANMDQTNPEVIRTVERALEARLSNMLSQSMEKTGGVETVAEILNLADRSTEKAIMEGLEAEDPDLVEEIRRRMFVFEDIVLVDDRGIQSVLKEIDNDELALALKTASQPLQDKVFSNMSERATALIKEDMEYMGPVRVSDVESAQQRIVDIVRRLEDAGEIIIVGRGGDKNLIV